MAHRGVLCRLDYFDHIFDGNFTVNELDSKPMCTLPDEYENMIIILLNHMYTNNLDYKSDIIKVFNLFEYDTMKIVLLFDFIGWFDVVCLLINSFYVQKTFDKFIKVIEYITDKENILKTLEYKIIFTVFVGKCVDENRFDLIDTIKYIDLDNIEIVDNIKYIKLLEYLCKIKGHEILSHVDIVRFIDPKSIYMCMYEKSMKYIAYMKKTSPVRNYLISQYMGHLYVCDKYHPQIICDTIYNFHSA